MCVARGVMPLWMLEAARDAPWAVHVPISPPNGLLLLNAGYDRLQARDVYVDQHAMNLNTMPILRANKSGSSEEGSSPAAATASTEERPAKRQKQERRKGGGKRAAPAEEPIVLMNDDAVAREATWRDSVLYPHIANSWHDANDADNASTRSARKTYSSDLAVWITQLEELAPGGEKRGRLSTLGDVRGRETGAGGGSGKDGGGDICSEHSDLAQVEERWQVTKALRNEARAEREVSEGYS